MLHRRRFLWPSLVLLLALCGSAWARRIESASFDNPSFLVRLNPQFAGWSHEDSDLSPIEMSLLQPDAYLIRRFTSKEGESVEFAIIAGHRKRSVHAPGFCMAGGGWETLRQSKPNLTSRGRSIQATQLLQTRRGRRILTTYFFTDGEVATTSFLHFQFAQLWKRFQWSVPLGAMVRIIAPVGTNPERAEALTNRVAADVLPGIMAGLRASRLKTK